MLHCVMNGMAPVDEKDFDLSSEDINLYEEFTDLLFGKNREKTKALLDEISEEANALASFFGPHVGVKYARERIVHDLNKSEAAWEAVRNSGRPYVTYDGYNRKAVKYDE